MCVPILVISPEVMRATAYDSRRTLLTPADSNIKKQKFTHFFHPPIRRKEVSQSFGTSFLVSFDGGHARERGRTGGRPFSVDA